MAGKTTNSASQKETVQCPWNCALGQNLRRHSIYDHLRRRHYKCEECNYVFLHQSLSAHKGHTISEPFKYHPTIARSFMQCIDTKDPSESSETESSDSGEDEPGEDEPGGLLGFLASLDGNKWYKDNDIIQALLKGDFGFEPASDHAVWKCFGDERPILSDENFLHSSLDHNNLHEVLMADFFRRDNLAELEVWKGDQRVDGDLDEVARIMCAVHPQSKTTSTSFLANVPVKFLDDLCTTSLPAQYTGWNGRGSPLSMNVSPAGSCFPPHSDFGFTANFLGGGLKLWAFAECSSVNQQEMEAFLEHGNVPLLLRRLENGLLLRQYPGQTMYILPNMIHLTISLQSSVMVLQTFWLPQHLPHRLEGLTIELKTRSGQKGGEASIPAAMEQLLDDLQLIQDCEESVIIKALKNWDISEAEIKKMNPRQMKRAKVLWKELLTQLQLLHCPLCLKHQASPTHILGHLGLDARQAVIISPEVTPKRRRSTSQGRSRKHSTALNNVSPSQTSSFCDPVSQKRSRFYPMEKGKRVRAQQAGF